jgi:hypothetical protein
MKPGDSPEMECARQVAADLPASPRLHRTGRAAEACVGVSLADVRVSFPRQARDPELVEWASDAPTVDRKSAIL